MTGPPQSPVAVGSDNLAGSDSQSSFSRGHTRAPNRPQNCSNQVTSDDDKTDEAVTALDPAFFGLRVDTSCARSLDMIGLELPPLSPLTPVPSDFEYDHLSSAPPVAPRRGPSRALKKQRKANSVPPKPKVTRSSSVKPAARISIASRAHKKDRVAAASRDPAALARKQSLRSSVKKPVGRSKKKPSGRKGAAATTSLGKHTARKSKPATPVRVSAPPLIYDTTGPTPDWIRRSGRLNPGMNLSSAVPASSPAPSADASPAGVAENSFASTCAEPVALIGSDDPAPSASPTIPTVNDDSSLDTRGGPPATRLEDARNPGRSRTPATSPVSFPPPLAGAPPGPCAAHAPPASAQTAPSYNASVDAVRSLDGRRAVSDFQAARPPVGYPFAIKCIGCVDDALDCIQGSGRWCTPCRLRGRACLYKELPHTPLPPRESIVQHRSSMFAFDEQSGSARTDWPPTATGDTHCAKPVGEAAPTELYEDDAAIPPHHDVVEVQPAADRLPVIQPRHPHLAPRGTSPPPTRHLHSSTAPRKRPMLVQESALAILARRRAALPSIHTFLNMPSTPESMPQERRRVQDDPGPWPESTQAPVQRADIPALHSRSLSPANRRHSDSEQRAVGPSMSLVAEGDVAVCGIGNEALLQSGSDLQAAIVAHGAVTLTALPTPQSATLDAATNTRFDAAPKLAPARERSGSALPSPEVVLDQTPPVVPTPAAMQPELLEDTPEPRRSKRKRAIVNMRELPLAPLKKRARAERELVAEKPRERLYIRIPPRSRSQTSAQNASIPDAAAATVDLPPIAIAEAAPGSHVDTADARDLGDNGEVAALPPPPPPPPDNVNLGRKRLWKDIARPRSVSISPKRPPLPSGCRPQLWALTRQEICETVPWFRTYQAGVYSKDNVVYGYMLGGFSAPRDVFEHDGRVIISHIGGGQEIVNDDDGGNDPDQLADPDAPAAKGTGHGRKTRLRQNQGESLRSHGAALNSAWENQHPVVLLADRQYSRFPYEFAPNETYYALGWYWIKYMWEEAEPGKQPTDSHTRVKVCFQWVESQGDPWWWPPSGTGHSSISSTTNAIVATDRVTQPRPQRQHRPRKVFSVQIREQSPGPGPHRQTCPECSSTSKRIYLLGWMCLNAQCDAFWTLEDGTSPRGEQFEMDPAFIALQETPPHVAALIRDYRPALPAVGNETTFTTSRSFHQGFLCDRCGRVSTRSQWESWQCPGCTNRFAINWPPHKASAWQAADGVPPWGQYKLHDESVKLQRIVLRIDDRGTIARVNKFILPHNRGSIFQILGNDTINAAADGILERYQSDFVKKPLFRRMPLANHGLSTTLLTQYFSQNSGVPYKYVAGTDSTIPFSEAPDSVNMALELITLRARLVAPRAEFNELLTAGYLEGQMMNFHSDYEKGLGEDVAALSLGSPALMKFRYNKSFAHRRVLEFTLNHGDILVMHGSGIQNCYEHTVIPTGFRIAATARLIDSRNALESSALARKPMQIGAAETVGLLPPLDLSGMTLVED